MFGARSARPFTEGQIRALYEAVGLHAVECGYGGQGPGSDASSAELRQTLIVVAEASGPRPVRST